MASRITPPARKSAGADASLDTLTQLLRDFFAAAAAPPPKASKKVLKAAVPTEDEDEEDDEDEGEDLPLPMGLPMGHGKGMRRITISILMPAKGTRPK